MSVSGEKMPYGATGCPFDRLTPVENKEFAKAASKAKTIKLITTV
jgi:hypothetical protein